MKITPRPAEIMRGNEPSEPNLYRKGVSKEMHKSKFRIALFLLLTLSLILAACGKRDETQGGAASPSETASSSPSATTPPSESASASPSAPASDPASPSANPYHDEANPVVTIEMDTGKTITLELYPKVAPNTVNNFISLIKKGFYDGIIFHRVMPGFMIQGGDPEGTGMGGPGYSIKGEFTINGFQNDLKHTRGVISMARKEKPLDSAGSQFFIMHADYPGLDNQYAAFGKVLDGLETVDEIATQEIDPADSFGTKPLKPMAIKKMTVDIKGVEYPEPETIKE